jgi:hypothetical protein
MSLTSAIDQPLQRAVAAGDVPGVAVVITTRAGPVYEGAFGERVLGGGVPMTPDTVVWIASLTKAITGTAAMREVERGNLDLEAPAKEILSELGEVQVLEGFDADGKPKLRAPKRDVTLRHLLTHTAGFSYEIWNPDILAYQQATGIPMITTCENPRGGDMIRNAGWFAGDRPWGLSAGLAILLGCTASPERMNSPTLTAGRRATRETRRSSPLERARR